MARNAAVAGRQPGFDLRLEQARQHRRRALGADCDDDGIAVDDRRHDERAFRWAVDDVNRNALRTRGCGHLAVEDLIVAGGENQRGAGRRLRRKTAPLDDGRGLGCQSLEILGDDLRHDAHARVGLGEQAQLLKRLFTAANDQDFARR